VQAENENAIGLYRDIGFEIAREWRVYARPEDEATHRRSVSSPRASRG
jgi:ribosomal protein S18 acetylase RimI-like enzyme